jgi:hypothetical protein
MLLDAGADPNAAGRDRGRILPSVAQSGNEVIVKMMLDTGTNEGVIRVG